MRNAHSSLAGRKAVLQPGAMLASRTRYSIGGPAFPGDVTMSTAVDAAPDDPRPKVKVFISYSRKDMAFTDLIEAALRARGIEPLIDRSEIYAFEDWWKRIEALIAAADTVVFVLSPDAIAS